MKLRNATSYSCRNRYGGATTPLSEHALANALDVSDFVFASGDHITVLDGWPRVAASTPSAVTTPAPKPSRVASVTRLDSEGIASSHAHLASGRRTRQRDRRDQDQGQPVRGAEPPQEAKPRRKRQRGRKRSAGGHAWRSRTTVAKSNPFVAPVPVQTATLKPDASTHRPPPAAKPAASAAPRMSRTEPTLAERQSAFIKDVHDEACEVFGTTLGPAANEAHKNHFHLDMKARKRAGFCE